MNVRNKSLKTEVSITMLLPRTVDRFAFIRLSAFLLVLSSGVVAFAQAPADRELEDVTILPAFSVKGDRMEDLGVRFNITIGIPTSLNALTVSEVFPNTAAAKAGLRPGERVEKIDGKLNRYLNLEDAFAAFEANPNLKREWRTHVHVPVFLDKIGQHFETTRFAIEDALKFHKKNKLSPQLEIETYTWDVLPDSMKTGSIVDYVQRELDWVKGQLV